MSDRTQVQKATSNAFTFLIDEEAQGDHQATEAFFLTFNVDLGFFEARLLGLLRATGARVTVVADATVWDPDTRAVRHAGRSYHLGLCDSRAAFHPKVMVLVGPKRAIAAVGSGNLTMGGWQYNSELLTVFTGNTDGMPTAFTDVLDLLSSLVDSDVLDPIAAKAARRTITALDALLKAAPAVDTSHRVHASWDGALIDRLPTGPVAELHLSAAFHDPAASAIRHLLDRLQPRMVQVAVQPGWTHLDPAVLDNVLASYAATTGATCDLFRDPTSEGSPDARYRHGKLIEWVTDNGERHAMTGSPNLSYAALIADVDSGGNHEVAVTGPSTRSLFPGGEKISAAEIPTLLVNNDDAGRPQTSTSTRAIAAVLTSDGQGIDVYLNCVATASARVEISPHSDSPDAWSPIGEIRNGQRTGYFRFVAPAGSRIRCAIEDPDTVLHVPTAPVYVTDLRRVAARSVSDKRTSRAHRAVAADLFGEDIALLDSLRADLATFAKDAAQSKRPTLGRETLPTSDGGLGRARGDDRTEPWLWLQNQTVQRYGTNLAAWLLALPQLAATSSGGEVPWLDKINDDTEVGLETEDTDTATAEVLATTIGSDASEAIDHDSDREAIKAARRKWAQKSAEVAAELPIDSRIFVLRLILAFWSAGNWPEDDTEPFSLTRNLIRSIANAIDADPPELGERVGALVAVALTVMRQRINAAVSDEKALRFREAAEIARPMLERLTEEAVELYVTGLRTGHEGTLLPGHVTDAIADLLPGDPLAVLEDQMLERGHEVTRPAPNHLVIHGSYSTPEKVALEALGMAEEHDHIAVWAVNDHGDWSLAAWVRPELVTVNKRGNIDPRWRHQRLRFVGPAAVATALKQGGPGNLPDVLLPKHKATPAARDVLARLGIETANPPTDG